MPTLYMFNDSLSRLTFLRSDHYGCLSRGGGVALNESSFDFINVFAICSVSSLCGGFCRAGKVISWQEFLNNYPPYSIALDGFVSAPPMRDPEGPRANYDHHKGVDRISTRSTSDQVYMEINLGLFQAFRKDGKPLAKLFINDCDEDTCLAVWLLKNHERVVGHGEPNINRLVFCEDRLDCTAGSYPFKDMETLRKMQWIFQPYQAARSEGRLNNLTPQALLAIVEAVGQRITAYSLGNAESLSLDGSFRTIGGGPGWSFVEKTGPNSRMHMTSSGINAYAMKISEGRYSIGRVSEWIPFPLEKIFELLNLAEPPGLIDANNHWGGSNTIGGSPRRTGSKLSDKQIEAIVTETMSRK